MKGPKAVLSSAIATALGEFFVVDASQIESNLLRDAKIVLSDLELCPITAALPNPAYSVTITGSVQKVIFAWAWGKSKQNGGGDWIKDATLEIYGIQVHAKSTEERLGEDIPTSAAENIEQAAAEHMEEEHKTKGLKAYVEDQVARVLDSLKLHVRDFQLALELPNSNKIRISAKSLQIESLGRLDYGEEEQKSLLKQRVSIEGLASDVILVQDGGDDEGKTYPLLDSFGYSADATRTGGKRFSDLSTCLEVVGRSSTDLVVHAGGIQLGALTQLGVTCMAPPDATTVETKSSSTRDISKREDATGEPSHFEFNFSTMSLVLDAATLSVSEVVMKYHADGTVMALEAGSFRIDETALAVQTTGIHASMVPPLTLRIDSIDKLYVENTIELTRPIINTIIVREGATVSMDMDSIEATLLEKKHSVEDQSNSFEEDPPNGSAFVAPFPASLSLKTIRLQNARDASRMVLEDLSVYINPKDQSTQLAIELGKFHNHLLELSAAKFFGSFPLEHSDQIDDFQFSAESAVVTAGRPAEEWQTAFNPREATSEKQTASSKKEVSIWKLPYAKVDPLKLVISFKSTGVSVKDTKITTEPYSGNAKATSKDLVAHYAQACLSRVSDFIPNAEVLGLNVVDTAASTWGGYLGMFSPLGPLGGVAAVTGVDAIKGAIAAGKKSRKVDEGAAVRPLDVVRGTLYSAHETAKAGAVARGGQQSSMVVYPLDLTLGALNTTTSYVGHNKSRLGAAGAGGGGMIAGAMLGGPVGAVLGGIVTQAIATKTFNSIEQHTEKRKEEKKRASS